MAMALNKFNQFVEDLAKKVHNLSSDTLTIALTNTAPVAGNSILSDITEISYTNFSGSRVVTINSAEQTSGTLELDLADFTILAAGGALPTFRYIVLYNDTPTSPLNPLICWWDYGATITLADGEALTVKLGTAPPLTIT